MAELKTLDLRPGGQTAHVWEGGDPGAPALLFLHPVTGIPRWGDALESLAANFHVIAPYQPGWGPAKDDLPGVRDGLDLVLFNVDLLNTLGVGSAHVVGVSIGAWIGAEMAAIRPDAVQSLTLVNPLGLWSEQHPGEDMFAQHPGFPTAVLFSDPEKRTELLMADRDPLDAYVEELLDLRASAKFLWPIPDTDVGRRLVRIDTRTLIATSENDNVVASEMGDIWRAAIPGAQSVELSGAGHIADLEAPAALADLVRNFALEGVTA